MRGKGGISPNLYLPILIANKEKIIFTMIYINTTDVFSQIGSVSEHLASFFNVIALQDWSSLQFKIPEDKPEL